MRPASSAGDTDYGIIGAGYSAYRRPDERIAALIHRGLGESQRVLNVGAGAGSYEPTDRSVVAVEPSAVMRAQRPPDLAEAIDAVAERLPFADHSFDASMAIFTVHQWPQITAGLNEMRRVTRGSIVLLTCDPQQVQEYWLNEYAPDVLAAEARRYPPIESLASALGNATEITPVPIPWDCRDGFNEAYFGRPEGLLEAPARRACSAWSFVDPSLTQSYVLNLRQSLDNGTWDGKYGHFRRQPHYLGSLRLIVSRADF